MLQLIFEVLLVVIKCENVLLKINTYIINYIDKVIPAAMLFVLQSEYQVYTAKKQNKHAELCQW